MIGVAEEGREPLFFDPQRAAGRVIWARAERVVDLLPGQHRPQVVASYRKAMREGVRFPPVAVVRLGPWLLLCDGHKRLAAFPGARNALIPLECWSWSRWIRDQSRQLGRNARKKSCQLGKLLLGRPEGTRLILDPLRHWKRLVLGLWGRFR